MPKTVDLVLDVAQALVRRLERAVLHLQRSILALQLFQRLQTGAHRRNLLLQSRAAGKKRRDQLINSALEFARPVRTEGKKISEDGAENQQRDDARATHRIA